MTVVLFFILFRLFLQTELETKIRGLVNREKHSSADLEITRDELVNLEKHEKTSGIEREKVWVSGCGIPAYTGMKHLKKKEK